MESNVKTMTLEQYQLEENMKLITKYLKSLEELRGIKLEFKDCFNVLIEDGKVYTTIGIPEFIDFQKQDVTEIVDQFLRQDMINNIATEIKRQMKEAME